MKEYICKEELLKAHHENTPITDNEDVIYGHVLFVKWVKCVPTVTKADICREFAEKLKKCLYRIDDSASLSTRDVVDEEDIDDVLAEMEQENG